MTGKRKKRVIKFFGLGLIFMIVLGILSGVYFYFTTDKEDTFSLNRVFLRTVIQEGESLSTDFNITNKGKASNFELELTGLNGFANLSETEFSLEKDKSKNIEVSFNSPDGNLGVFVGSIIIKNDADTEILPVVLEIQSRDTFFSSKIDASSRYKEISKGEELVTELTIFNLRDNKQHDVSIKYNVYNSDGNSVYSDTKNAAIGTRSSITKSVTLPHNLKEGKHFLTAVVELNGFVSTASYLFNVREEKLDFLAIDMRIISSITGILLIIIFIVLIYIIYERNKLFNELKKQHSSEISLYSKGIDNEKKNSLSKAKNKKERKKIVKEFEKAKKEVISKIKEQHKEQKKELKKLRNRKDKSYLRKKIKEWKSDIYPKAVKKAEIDSKLKMKLNALQKAYDEGYISKDSYKKGKSRIKSKQNK